MLLLILTCLNTVKAQGVLETDLYKGLVFGMGWGTFLILIFIIIGAILIFFRKLLYYPWLIIVIGIGLPVITFVILYLWPKKRDDDTSTTTTYIDDEPTDFFLLKIGMCFALSGIFFFASLFCLAYATIFRFVYARREDTARIEKFRRTKDVDSDDEEEEAFAQMQEMDKYDLEEEEEEDESEADQSRNITGQMDLDYEEEKEGLIQR